MSERTPLADVLQQLMREKQWSLERLAHSSGVSKKTIHNWLKPSGVRRPHTWQPLVEVAAALRLNRAELARLLDAAQQPPLESLLEQGQTPQDQARLLPWTATPPHNLPSATTSFVGREAELATLAELLAQARLVLLTGPGGSGKTRLGCALAERVLDAFPDGVFLVDLVPIADAQLVVPTIAQVLGVHERPRTPLLDALKQHLRSRRMLLLLDNFEQVVAAAPVIGELLAAAPGLKVLVTSRTVLHLSGEHEYVVAPLALPPLDPSDQTLPPLEQLRETPSVALFIERAQTVKPGFQLTSHNAAAVAEICARLDGLPLAIELAAARVKVLPPQTLLARLNDASGPAALRLLGAGPRDLAPRHQTLAAMIEWSYALLSPAEQRLFAWLSVLVGSWSLDRAEAVCAAVAADTAEPALDVLDGVSSLLDKSLLVAVEGADGLPRFRMLVTICEYARLQLERSGEEAALRAAHARAYTAFVEHARSFLCGPEQQHWLRRLKHEHDNLRAALGWALATDSVELAQRLAASLSPFWSLHGHQPEGRRWMAQVLRYDGADRPALWATLLRGAGKLAVEQGDYAEARGRFEQTLVLRQQLEQPQEIARALNDLGSLARAEGDYARSAALHHAALALARAEADTWTTVHTLMQLGRTAVRQGDAEQAQRYFDEGVLLDDQPNDILGLAILHYDLGSVAYLKRNYARAMELWQQSLAFSAELEDKPGRARALIDLGSAALGLGDLALARDHLTESLRLSQELADKHGLADSLAGLAIVAGRQGDLRAAVRLNGAQVALREAGGLAATTYQAALTETLDQARRVLDETTWTTTAIEGRALPLEQIVAEVGRYGHRARALNGVPK